MLRGAQLESPLANQSITWVAKAGTGLKGAELEGTELFFKDPQLIEALNQHGMPERVDLNSFDALVFVGDTASVFNAGQLLQRHSVSGWPSAEPMLRKIERTGGVPFRRQMLSQSAYLAALSRIIESGVTYELVSQIRVVTDIPICIIPQPYPGAQLLKIEGKKNRALKRVIEERGGEYLSEILRNAHANTFSKFTGVSILYQPEQTIEYGCLTGRAFTRNAVRIHTDMKQPARDIIHSNPTMGHLVLEQILAALHIN